MHKIITDAATLRERWTQCKPFPYILLDNVLHEDTILQLLEDLSKEDFELKNSDLFTFYQTNDLNTSTSTSVQNLKNQLIAKPVIDALRKITNKNIGTDIDLHATIYEDTHHLLCHDDDLEERALAFIIYLTDLEEDEGGQLVLYNTQDGIPTTVHTSIVPQAGRMVLFGVGDGSWHAVTEIICDTQRIALAGWYHASK